MTSSSRLVSPSSTETINKGQIQISFVVDDDNGEQQTTAQRHEQHRRKGLFTGWVSRGRGKTGQLGCLVVRLQLLRHPVRDQINLHVQRFKECRAQHSHWPARASPLCPSVSLSVCLSRLCKGDSCLRDRVTIRCRQQRREAPRSLGGRERGRAKGRTRNGARSFVLLPSFVQVMRSLSLICAHSETRGPSRNPEWEEFRPESRHGQHQQPAQVRNPSHVAV